MTTRPPTALDIVREDAERLIPLPAEPVGPDVAEGLLPLIGTHYQDAFQGVSAQAERKVLKVMDELGSADRAIWEMEEYNRQARLEGQLAHYEASPEWRTYVAAQREAEARPPRPRPELPWMRNSLARPHA
jgi:hypothetical protein